MYIWLEPHSSQSVTVCWWLSNLHLSPHSSEFPGPFTRSWIGLFTVRLCSPNHPSFFILGLSGQNFPVIHLSVFSCPLPTSPMKFTFYIFLTSGSLSQVSLSLPCWWVHLTWVAAATLNFQLIPSTTSSKMPFLKYRSNVTPPSTQGPQCLTLLASWPRSPNPLYFSLWPPQKCSQTPHTATLPDALGSNSLSPLALPLQAITAFTPTAHLERPVITLKMHCRESVHALHLPSAPSPLRMGSTMYLCLPLHARCLTWVGTL